MRVLFAGLLALLLAVQARAIQVTDLYQVDETLPAGEQVERKELFGRAFDSLLWRITGLKTLEQYPALQQLRADPQELIRGYSNRNTFLRIRFDPASLLAGLQQQELAIWGEQRPVLLLWWTQQDAHGQHLYNEDQRMARLVAGRAAYRGLPVRFPLADLQEQILTERLQLQDQEQVEQLLQRYGADLLLRVSVDDQTQPGAGWQLYEQGRLRKGSLRAEDVPGLADGIFLEVGQYLIQKYAVLQGQGDALHIQVAGLDFERLLMVENLLEPFAARLLLLDADRAVWQVRAMPEQLRALFELQQIRQQPNPEPVPEPVPAPELQPESGQELELEQELPGQDQQADQEPEQEPAVEQALPDIDMYFQ